MNGRRVANPVLMFIYLACFYSSIAFPWTHEATAVYGLKIGGYVIEFHLFMILGVLLPFYLISRSALQSIALRRTVTVCWVVSFTCGLFFLGSVFFKGGTIGFGFIVNSMMDIKTWLLLWMMPVTVLYIYDRGLDRWFRHFFIATGCYCTLMFLIRIAPYGLVVKFLPWGDAALYGRVSMSNNFILTLAVPVAVAWLMDRGFSLFVAICLGLYISTLFFSQGRTVIGSTSIITMIVILRNARLGRTIIALFAIIVGIYITVATLPEVVRNSLIARFSNLGEQTKIYTTMLGTSNEIAIDAIKDDPIKIMFGAGLGTWLDLYGGATEEGAVRKFVDNLWVTLLFKVGIVGLLSIGGAIIYLCWGSAWGRPLSNVDRLFKLWAFFMPFLCLRNSFLLYNTTNGVIWATLAVSAVFAEERYFAGFATLPEVEQELLEF